MSHKIDIAIGLTESVAITTLLLFVGYYFHRSDPFFLRSTFPWLLLAPLLVTLRFGFWHGLVSNILIIATMYTLGTTQLFTEFSTYLYILGMGIVTFICGEFNSSYEHRLLLAQQLNSYAKQRLGSLTRAYHVLKLSHDRLEQPLVTKPITLRKIFTELKCLLVDSNGELTTTAANKLISLLEQYCYLTKAAIYPMQNGKPANIALAHIGSEEQLDRNNVLITETLCNKQINYVAINKLKEEDSNDYLAVVPMRTSDEKLIGLFVVMDMPFWSLNDETLQIVYALLSYFADEKWAVSEAIQLLQHYKTCPLLFASSIYKLQRLERETDIESTIFIITIPVDTVDARNIMEKIAQEQRSLDIQWIHQTKSHWWLLSLKPFFRAELISNFSKRAVEKYKKHNISVNFVSITQESPITIINNILQRTQ